MLFLILPRAALDVVRMIRPYVELRERFERHLNPTFSGPANANRSDLFTRFRVGLDVKASSLWSAKVEYQNADDLFWTHKLNNSADSSDLSLGYVKYSASALTTTGGRQRIELGQQRLIGSTDWLNLARSFDAARAGSGQWDAWFGKIGEANSEPLTARVGALTHKAKAWGETSLIFKHDVGTVADIDIQTLDHLITRKFGHTTLDAEGALQYGSNNGRDQRAWAWHARATQDLCAKTTLSVEADAASGGHDSTTSRTFDNLYPSNHDLYGLADLVAWKNMNQLGVVLENRSVRDLTLRAEGHTFSLRDPTDSWYGATGVPNARPGGTFIDPTGASGRFLGQELDLGASYSLKKLGTVSAGLALFEPGDYVKNVSGHSNQLTFGYFQYQIKF